MRTVARAGLLAALVARAARAVLVAVHGNPVHELQVKWREFKSLQATNTSSTRYTSTGGQRYDLWRVAALRVPRGNPVGGVGEGSYEFGYYRLRRSNRNLSDPHGLLFQLGAELGAVGLLLFALDPRGADRLDQTLVAAGPARRSSQRLRPDRRRRDVHRPVAGGLDVADPRAHRAGRAVSGRGGRAARALGDRPCRAPARRRPPGPAPRASRASLASSVLLGGRSRRCIVLDRWRRAAAAAGLLLALALVALPVSVGLLRAARSR